MEKPSTKLLTNPAHFISLGFGTGLSPHAPGTVGSVVGVLIFFIISELPVTYYLAVVIGFFILGIFICGFTAEALQADDHPAIVWDEVVGYLVAMVNAPTQWWWAIIGFVLFRLLDILKPWPINLADKNLKGGVGIMVDDLIAGIFSLTLIQIIAYILYT